MSAEQVKGILTAYHQIIPASWPGLHPEIAADAGLSSVELLGLDDFDRRLPWVHQAAQYRADDEAVVRSDHPRLNIVERQRAATGAITWVRVGKAPIRTATGVIGVLGAYEILDPQTGHRLFAEKIRGNTKQP